MFRASAFKTSLRATRPRRQRPVPRVRITPQSGPSTSRSASTSPIPVAADDASLVPFFDVPTSSCRSSAGLSTGLLSHPHLTTPSTLDTLAEGAMKRADSLMNRILNAQKSRDDLYMVIKNMDKVSDLLCGVIDLTELIRNAHPDPVWIQGADNVYDKLCGYMNTLNTHMGLYKASSLTAGNIWSQ